MMRRAVISVGALAMTLALVTPGCGGGDGDGPSAEVQDAADSYLESIPSRQFDLLCATAAAPAEDLVGGEPVNEETLGEQIEPWVAQYGGGEDPVEVAGAILDRCPKT